MLKININAPKKGIFNLFDTLLTPKKGLEERL